MPADRPRPPGPRDGGRAQPPVALTEVLDSLSGRLVQDVLVPGWLETGGGHPRFEPWSYVVYLHLDDGYLRLEADQGSLVLSRTDRITVPPELADEDDEFAVSSLGSLFIFDGHPTPLVRVRYWLDRLAAPGRAVVHGAEFEVRGGVRLFADPMWMPGMRLATGGFHDLHAEDLARRREIFGMEEHVFHP